MRTLVEKVTNISVHLFNDDDGTVLEADGLYRDGVLHDGLYNVDTATIEAVDAFPEDWVGKKYLYVEGQWQLNTL